MTKDLDIFKLFKRYTDKIVDSKPEVSKALELQVAFMTFSIKTYPSNISYVNQILDSCLTIVKASPIAPNDQNSMKLLVKLLSIPLDSLSIQVLRMETYP